LDARTAGFEILLLRGVFEADTVEFLARNARNPFDIHPLCEQYVPGYGATTADFHVVGDHPGTHGGLSTGVPFTDKEWSEQFFDALADGGLVESTALDERRIESPETFFSYIHMCAPETVVPDRRSYDEMEPFFDAELRAITAHVLFPVGKRATKHVFGNYTAIDPTDVTEMDDIHAGDRQGAGWLVMPIKDPGEWTGDDRDKLVSALETLLASDYQQITDLGRFLPDEDPYFVR
jgi:uracil-DNA glycosylase